LFGLTIQQKMLKVAAGISIRLHLNPVSHRFSSIYRAAHKKSVTVVPAARGLSVTSNSTARSHSRRIESLK
jgi:hypothetical protein